MPFESVIYPQRRLIVTTGTGVLTGEEGLACCVGLKKRPEFDPSFDQLLDLTAATKFNASPDDMRRIAQESLFSPSSRRAIIAIEPGIFGLARMFEAFRGLSDVGEQVSVFRDMKQALDWLSSPQVKSS
ncbi:MAG TPA: hypothetical protein VMH85_20985 [Terriglobales bacterium]|nr:hypothetical protein [Terriglobales bacterium]